MNRRRYIFFLVLPVLSYHICRLSSKRISIFLIQFFLSSIFDKFLISKKMSDSNTLGTQGRVIRRTEVPTTFQSGVYYKNLDRTPEGAGKNSYVVSRREPHQVKIWKFFIKFILK